jgi:hypothetical protein
VRIPAIFSPALHDILTRGGVLPSNVTAIAKSKYLQPRQTVISCSPKEKPGTWPGQMVKKAATQSSPRQSWRRQEKSAELSTISVDKIKARWANQAGFRRNFDYEEIVPKYSGVFKARNTSDAFLG